MHLTVSDHKSGRRQIAVEQIEYLAGLENYSLIHINGEKPLLLSRTLKVMSERLPDFIRIHKRILINPLFIADYVLVTNTSDSFVTLTSGRVLPISRRRVPLIKSLLCKLSSSPVA